MGKEYPTPSGQAEQSFRRAHRGAQVSRARRPALGLPISQADESFVCIGALAMPASPFLTEKGTSPSLTIFLCFKIIDIGVKDVGRADTVIECRTLGATAFEVFV